MCHTYLAISSYKAELDNELMLLLKLQFEKQYTCTIMLLVLLSMCPHKQHHTICNYHDNKTVTHQVEVSYDENSSIVKKQLEIPRHMSCMI